jgi:hypothetical protein
MKLADLDINIVATAILAVILVVGALVLNGLGHPTPEWLVSALSLAIGAYFGQARSTPGLRDHTAALQANTAATQQSTAAAEQVAQTLATAPVVVVDATQPIAGGPKA